MRNFVEFLLIDLRDNVDIRFELMIRCLSFVFVYSWFSVEVEPFFPNELCLLVFFEANRVIAMFVCGSRFVSEFVMVKFDASIVRISCELCVQLLFSSLESLRCCVFFLS